jgi:hypothetical protein
LLRKRCFIFSCLAAAFMLYFAFATGQAAAEQPTAVNVYLDGLPVLFDVQPEIHGDRTMAPFRALAEALSVKVDWDGTTNTVTARNSQTTVRLQIGNATAYLNNVPVQLDVPPMLVNDRTVIPLRFFSESFKCRVEWEGATNIVRLFSPPATMAVTAFYALGDTATSSWTGLFGTPFPSTARGHTDQVSRLALGWYSLDQDGNLLTSSSTGWQRPEGWQSVLAAAKKYNLETEMVVHLTDGQGTLSNLLSNPSAVHKAVTEIAREATGYNGVNLDLEGLGLTGQGEELTKVRNSYTEFVRQLAVELKANNLQLTLSLHPSNSAYRGYDYRALGELADQIIVMAYDYGPKPEPVNLVTQSVEEAIASVPAGKVLLGISAPGETPQSLLVKAGIAKRYNLGGIALWRLGLVPAEAWDTLKSTIQPR